MTRTAVDELLNSGRFEHFRRILHSERYTRHLDEPLAFWVLPTDRHLPLPFLNRTLRDLLDVPFADLAATPGVGDKKIDMFLKLLSRAVSTDPDDLVVKTARSRRSPKSGGESGTAAEKATDSVPNPDSVTEVEWRRWQASVTALGLDSEPLGRLTSSLRDLPAASWMVPLEKYTQPTLGEIRKMKTHGQKRVRAIVEVFHHVHRIASGGHAMEQLVQQLCSPRVAHARQWTDQTLRGSAIPSVGEIREHFILPLLMQIEIDGAERLVLLARHRLGLDGPEMSVRDVSRRMGLTRARVYQMLDIINDILMLRWPDGRRMVHELCDRLAGLADTDAEFAELSQFFAAVELFYPRRRRLAMIVPPGPVQKRSPAERRNREV